MRFSMENSVTAKYNLDMLLNFCIETQMNFWVLLSMHIKYRVVKKYQRTVCPKGYYSKAVFNHHMLIHSEKSEFQCKLCSKSLRGKSGLKKHMAHLHSDKRNFTCKVCGKGFKTKDIFTRHSKVGGVSSHAGYIWL